MQEKFKKIFLTIIVLLFLSFMSFIYAQAFIFSDIADHYSFDLPAGWEEIPKDVVDSFVDEVARQTQGQRIEYVAGFQLSDKEYFQYPYILVQEYKFEFDTPSYREIEKIFNMGSLDQVTTNKIKEYSELVRNAKFDQPFVDKERNIIFVNIQADVVNIGAVNGLMVMFLGKGGIVQLNFYSVKDEYSRWLPVFNSIIDSFQYDIGHEYSPVENVQYNSLRVSERVVIGAIMGALLGLSGALFLFLRRKKKLLLKNDYEREN